MDVFYNGAIDNNTSRSLYRKRPEGYSQIDKIRAGVSLNNEFKFGLLTAILDWGVYFYNPSRNIYYDYYADNHRKVAPKRPLAYKTPHGAGGEEAPHYFRLGARCRIWDNLYFQTTMKCHLQIAEFIEFGLGYQIPFYKKGSRPEGKSNIFHYRKEWWKE